MAPIKPNEPTAKATKKGTKTKGGGDRGSDKNTSIEGVEQRILVKMAERAVFNVKEVSLDELVKFSGYKWSTAPKFSKAKQALIAKGHLVYLKETKSFRVTEAGLGAVPNGSKKLEMPKTNEAFHEQLHEQFEKPKSSELFARLSDGCIHQRQETCSALGYKYTTAQPYAQAVSELKNLGFLEPAGKGAFRLTDKAFPCGRSE